jgi:hypothetical protein
LFVNFFQPSFKLAEKHRDGARVHKRYHAPATPHQRLIDDPRTTDATKAHLSGIFAQLDPVRRLRDIRAAQQRLVVLSDGTSPSMVSEEPTPPPLDAFLSSLRTVWQSGDARPTASDKPRQKRGRRRPDPLVEVTGRLKRWFEDEPWRSGRELLEKLQAETPGDYPEGLLRTVQRRVKIWRSEQACALVFTHSSAAPKAAASSIWSIWSTSSNRKRPLGAAGTSSRNCCDTISSSSTNSAICRSASQARNCCST